MLTVVAAGLSGCSEAAERTPPAPARPIERRAPLQAPGSAEPATSVRGTELAALSTLAQIDLLEPPTRDLRDLAVRLNPDLDAVPLTVPGPPPAWRLGDQERFWVRNTSTNRAVEITATLAYSTPVAYVWVETGQSFDLDAIMESIDRFSAVTYPNVVSTFGSEWRPGVDNDDRLHILYNTQMGSGVVGYFSGSDEYTRLASPFSNQKEMFYINLALFRGTLDRARNLYFHDTTLAHEFQHMIHWHMDRGEDLWVNEGLSEYAPEVAEFAPDTAGVGLFAAAPDLQLTTWGTSNANNLPHYASAYLFMAYLAQRFGPEAIAELVAAPANGMHGVNAALTAVQAPIDAEQLFADWVVANYADQPTALGEDGRYGYSDLPVPKFAPVSVHESTAFAPQRADVFNFATDYIELAGKSDVPLTLVFTGTAATRLAAADLSAGRAWWGNRADDSEARLTQRYDLRGLAAGTPLTLTAAMWWDIEHDYDYGYVLASRDGEHWEFLRGQYTATDNPSGNALGPGYTGISRRDRAGSSDSDSGNDLGSDSGSDSGSNASSGSGGEAGNDPGDSASSEPAGVPQWVDERFDLTPYAGGELWLQFSYVTDDAVNLAGWLVDDIQVQGPAGPIEPTALPADAPPAPVEAIPPAATVAATAPADPGAAANAETDPAAAADPGTAADPSTAADPTTAADPAATMDAAAWQSEGWLLIDNRLPQRWLVQVLEFDGDTLAGVRQVPIDPDGRGQLDLGVLGNGRRAVVAVSGLTPVTTLPAGYEYSLVPTIPND
jgi:hypothetical protein